MSDNATGWQYTTTKADYRATALSYALDYVRNCPTGGMPYKQVLEVAEAFRKFLENESNV